MPIRRPVKRAAPRRARTSASASHVVPVVAPARHHNLCQSCHALPVGSMELVAVLLVLVFSLSAVLFTSVYSLRIHQVRIQTLSSQIK